MRTFKSAQKSAKKSAFTNKSAQKKHFKKHFWQFRTYMLANAKLQMGVF